MSLCLQRHLYGFKSERSGSRVLTPPTRTNTSLTETSTLSQTPQSVPPNDLFFPNNILVSALLVLRKCGLFPPELPPHSPGRPTESEANGGRAVVIGEAAGRPRLLWQLNEQQRRVSGTPLSVDNPCDGIGTVDGFLGVSEAKEWKGYKGAINYGDCRTAC